MYYDKIIYDDPRFPLNVLPYYESARKYTHLSMKSPSYHEQVEILYFLDGETAVVVKDKTFHCKKGDIVIVNPHELHNLYGISGNVVYHCIIIGTTLISAKNDITNEKYIKPIENHEILFNNFIRDEELGESIIILVDEMIKKESCYELAAKAQLYTILTILTRKYAAGSMTTKEKEKNLKNLHLVEKSMDYIRANLKNRITLGEIAKHLSISEYYFARTFKSLTGMTVFEYVEEMRISHAKTLLAESDMSIAEIASACGYNDPSYFSKTFKDHTGLTPKEYTRI